ncbi:MAG: hypothetical protein DGJ47_000990 [Rickettsiaceae bacterium]
MPFDIDITIVIAFLVVNLGVGLYYGRDVKTIEDYATGGRNFSTAALVSTIVATSVTGSLFAIGVSRTYSHGLYDLIPTCGMPIARVLLACLIIPKMKSFFTNISMAEAMGKHYGKSVRVITAVCAIIGSIGVIAIQHKAFGSLVGYLFNIGVTNAIIMSGILVTIYSAFGGIRSVTFTDILQFIIFGTVIPLIGIILWKNTIGVEGVYDEVLKNDVFNFDFVMDIHNKEFLPMVLLFLYFATPSSNPVFFQRIVMGQSIKQVTKAFYISAIVLLAIIASVAWIGFLLFALDPNLDSQSLIPHIVENYSYSGLKGLVIIGVMAMAMSSADSYINITSVLVTHDILKSINFNPDRKLAVARLVAIIIGLGSILLALSTKDLLSIILSANAFYMPIVTVPFLFTMAGFRTTSKSVLSGMLGGFLTVIIWKTVGISFDPIIPAMLVNLIVMMSVHYLGKQKGGWIEVEMEKPEAKENDGVLCSIYKSVRYFNFAEFVYKNSPRSESTYSFFGIFCFVSTLSTIYLTQREMLGEHGDLITIFYIGMLIVSSFFGLHMMWSDRIRNPMLVSTVWHFALIYNMTFCTTFFLLLSNFHNVQMMVFSLSIMALFNLCRWTTALTVILFGVGSSIITYQKVMGDALAGSNVDNYNILMYVALIVAAALFAFSKPKQEYVEQTEEKVDDLEKKVGSLTIESSQKDKKIQYFNRAMQANERRITDLRDKISQKNSDLKITRETLEKNNDEIIKLEKEVKIKERQYKELDNSSKYNMENARITQYSIEDMKKKLSELKENVALKEHHVKELHDDIQQSNSSIDELNLEIKRGAKKVATLKKQIQTREEKISELTAQVKVKDGEILDAHDKAIFFEEKYVVQEKEIERLNKTSNRILNNVTHELRLPVGNVMNFAEMLSEQVEGMKDNHLKMLSDEVFQNSTRLSTMILNMLDLMTLNLNKMELDKQMMNVGEIVKERVDRCKKIYLDDKPIKFKLKIESDMLAPVDVHYMKQVIDNLVINAIKFSEQGTVTISAHKEHENIFVYITDEGKGIPALEIYDIFTPFMMASNSASKAEGRGVGLALCKAAIEAHGGSIKVDSKNEIGAQFSIRLPL